MYQSITTTDLAHIIESGANITLIDVREIDEWEQIRIPQAVLIPLSTIEHRLEEIDFSRPVYVLCRSGGRSANVCAWLESHSKQATNITGGIKQFYQEGSNLLEVTEHLKPKYLG